jgi:two-component system NtrC family sensor kinase
MSWPRRIVTAIKGTVRYKLLVLVLFPILLVMPIALLLASYWGTNFTYDQLYIKVNTDLSVADDIFRRIRKDYLERLARLAESYAFRTALEADDHKAIHQLIQQLNTAAGFTYLHLVDPSGNWLYESTGQSRSSPMLLRANQGQPQTGVEIFSAEDLTREFPRLADINRLSLIETPRARPTQRTFEDRGMMVRVIYPVKDAKGRVLALLDGGVLLNNNFQFVDTIRDLVYGSGSLPKGSIGTVTVFLDDVRITTNVPLRPGERALGTRVSNEVRTRVLDEGNIWIDRAFVVNDWYISAYEPIVNPEGKRIGMLYAGFLEAPFRTELWRALAALVLLFLILMVLSALVAVRGAKAIFKPIEAMSNVVRATRAGENLRIGKVDSQDELGELAREFDSMLDLLQQRSREIQQWADQLEAKVEERTAELKRKNADLRSTINVLRETRRQLVVAEKLAALGELTAGVAHEINNPTAVMLGNLDVLVAELGPAVGPVQHEVNLIIEQIYRIKDIINNLLQYARPSEFAGYAEELDVNDTVESTLQLVQHLRNQSIYDIHLELEASRPVRINRHELQQVLVNLITNAIHALPEQNGKIEIRTRDWDRKGVVIRLRDNGAGLDEDQISRIFNPFYSTKGQGSGTGLGLSVSYGLIRRYGGMITVESVPGEGSEFFIWLLSEPEFVEDEETITEQLHASDMDKNTERQSYNS